MAKNRSTQPLSYLLQREIEVIKAEIFDLRLKCEETDLPPERKLILFRIAQETCKMQSSTPRLLLSVLVLPLPRFKVFFLLKITGLNSIMKW
jgi:hypothetical protein